VPIYMDIHEVPGIEALDAANAHQKDMLIQHEYQCKCMTYWIDEPRGVVFCLIEAPDKSVVEEMHRHSHGLIPHKIIDVNNDLVESFLGRIHDPEEAVISNAGLKVFSDSAFRFLLVTDNTDPVLLQHTLGSDKAGELMQKQNTVIRKAVSKHGGREVEHAGKGFIVSFSSAVKAISCALEMQNNLAGSDRAITGFKIGVNAGDPVSKSDSLFGDTIQLARQLCTIAGTDQVIVSNGVKDLLTRNYSETEQKNMISPTSQDESLIGSLFGRLEENWQDPDFGITQFCKKMAMSKSQLYRKTMSLWGLSPNQLLKEFRLDKARELLKTHQNNISQTTFDSGFTSPSYFTKCFKKKFGLLPANYLGSLQS
jgi:AraC-like DNA-binding protein